MNKHTPDKQQLIQHVCMSIRLCVNNKLLLSLLALSVSLFAVCLKALFRYLRKEGFCKYQKLLVHTWLLPCYAKPHQLWKCLNVNSCIIYRVKQHFEQLSCWVSVWIELWTPTFHGRHQNVDMCQWLRSHLTCIIHRVWWSVTEIEGSCTCIHM